MYLLLAYTGHAQYNTLQNTVWPMGLYSGVSFATGIPMAISTAIEAAEGSAAVCDAEGSLLFYTEGRTIWDRTHTIMLGGDSVCPNACFSNMQGAAIAPVLNYGPGSGPRQYYVFSIYSLEYVLDDTSGLKLYYSIVDMDLNGGLGGVVPGMSRIYMASRMCEKMITIPGDSCDLWLLVHRMEEPVFYAYHITACGLDPTPVVSVAGDRTGWFAYGGGIMKASPDRHRLAVCNFTSSTSTISWSPVDTTQIGTELFDFDPATGRVSNAVSICRGKRDMYTEFSPDNSKLYVTSMLGTLPDTGVLWQYDVTDTAAIQATKYMVARAGGTTHSRDMRLGADGKVYVCESVPAGYLNCIAAPNAAGAACTYMPNVLTSLPASSFIWGITNLYNAPITIPEDTTISTTDTTICFYDTDTVLLTAPFTGCVRWYDGSSLPTHVAIGEGQYSLTSVEGCLVRRHTFNVIAAPLPCIETGIGAVDMYTDMTLYPQPATDACVLRSGKPLPAGAEATVYDMTGRAVANIALAGTHTTIPLGHLPAGVYQVRIQAAGTVILRKMAVLH
ncbi:hypothetical protein GCM10023093_18110 [Nemorincola caseinilytica]|uniref:Secretion system C-terminal sorting domain-containing protein n=1 Tax=Nemorincola caseinilytica TaxID=2054315 RepID=A0ABP8NEA5_9BACT